MDESSKTRKIWSDVEKSVLVGRGIDIGCGPDPVTPEVRRFDLKDGDANEITRFVHEQFDFVYSSHCLEHMREPRKALLEWWKLVKPGGHLFFIVPDEDLYEQGVFPSRFNPDHKATFTLSKSRSWSPVSINMLDLVHSLPAGRLVSLKLQDEGYDRSLCRHGHHMPGRGVTRLQRVYSAAKRALRFQVKSLEELFGQFQIVDQTLGPMALAQIQCIVQKLP